MITVRKHAPHARDINLRLLKNGSTLIIKPPQRSLEVAFAQQLLATALLRARFGRRSKWKDGKMRCGAGLFLSFFGFMENYLFYTPVICF